jgi:hypothetical protein
MRYVRNPEGIDRQLMRHINDGLQQHFDKARALIDQVNAEMAGQPADEVLIALISRLRAAGMKPIEADLRKRAESISAGTYA